MKKINLPAGGFSIPEISSIKSSMYIGKGGGGLALFADMYVVLLWCEVRPSSFTPNAFLVPSRLALMFDASEDHRSLSITINDSLRTGII